jgi:hypothetical protein
MRARRLLIIAASLTPILGLAACGDDDASTAEVKQRTLTFVERPTDNFSFDDAAPKTKLGEEGPERLSNGDQLTFSSDLLDDARKDAGDLEVVCAVTRPGGFDAAHVQCNGTATLPGGVITLSRGGRVFAGDDPTGSILGGTGACAGATGVFSEAERAGDQSTYTFRVSVPATAS